MELKTIFSKNEHKPIIGSDFDGVVTEGIIPERGTIILTGKSKDEEEEMRELLPNKNRIVFFPNPEELTDKNKDKKIGQWKAEKIAEFGVGKFYEDNQTQAKIIQEYNPAVEVIHVKNEEKKDDGKLKFFIISGFGELLDIAIQLEKVEKYETIFYVSDPDFNRIGDGIVTKDDKWHNYIGKGYIWIIDGCEQADLQDWLRDQGEYVVGTNKIMADYENNRQKGQELFKKAGFYQPFSKNFTNIEECLQFVEKHLDKKYILKQNGDLPKSVNHKAHFEDNIDLIFHLNELKKTWSETNIGKFDCDLMECVSGMEVAVSAFFNGNDFLRDKDGKVVGFINHEQKKACDGDLGSTTGEMGTLFNGVDEDDKLFKDIMMKPEIVKVLKDSNYRGAFDINCIVTDDGIVGLEPTSRFGIPATSYEFIEAMESGTGHLLATMAMGEDNPIRITKGWGIVQVIVSMPFPIEADLEETATSLGEKLWIIKDEKAIDDFTKNQLKHIHLENFKKTDNGDYIVATKSGYLLTITGTGKDIADCREKMLEYIKENIYISDFWFRQDLGKNVEKYYDTRK